METRIPGEESVGKPATDGGKHDPDAAVQAGKGGGTHKVAKARPAVPEAKVERPDTLRPPEAAVNLSGEITYDEAMAQLAAGTLKRSVLTEQGWVFKPPVEPPRGAR
jgi:hypothetical protein